MLNILQVLLERCLQKLFKWFEDDLKKEVQINLLIELFGGDNFEALNQMSFVCLFDFHQSIFHYSVVINFVLLYGISIIVGYLMPNPFLFI